MYWGREMCIAAAASAEMQITIIGKGRKTTARTTTRITAAPKFVSKIESNFYVFATLLAFCFA